jgi:hypothetical protein
MRHLFLASVIFCAVPDLVNAQSKSYKTLHSQFADGEDVKSYRLRGLMIRLVAEIVEDEDQRLAAALRDVKRVRLMTIPKEEFTVRDVTVSGFKSRLSSDRFELMGDFRDEEGSVAFFHREEKRGKNCYFVIIDQDDEVIAIEMKGYIDPVIMADGATLTSN